MRRLKRKEKDKFVVCVVCFFLNLVYTFAHSNRRPIGSASLNMRSNCHFATDKSSIYIREPATRCVALARSGSGFRFPTRSVGIGVFLRPAGCSACWPAFGKVQRFKKRLFVALIFCTFVFLNAQTFS
jgi:hypothetical protein